MRLKTYSAVKMHDVLAQIRKELGSDAIIVATEQRGGVYHVTAALETVMPAFDPMPLPSWAGPGTEQVQKEFSSARPARHVLTSLELIDIFCRCLEYHVVPPEVSDDLLGQLRLFLRHHPQEAYDVDDVMAHILPCSPLSYEPFSVVVLQGLAGVGKTLTAGKLAYEYLLAGEKPWLLTLDTLKAGSVDQLQTYAQALQIPFEKFSSLSSLLRFLKTYKAKNPVIVDTLSLHPSEEEGQEALSLLPELEHGMGQEYKCFSLLVSSADTDSYTFLDHLDFYQKLEARHMIVTRCDTTQRLGVLLTAMSQLRKGPFSLERLTLSSIGLGPALGDRLHPASGARVLDLFLSPLNQSRKTQNIFQNQDNTPDRVWREVAR